MIDKDFLFQTWHAMWSWRLHIFLLLTSGFSRCILFERILSNHHYLHDHYDLKWEIGWNIRILNFKHETLCEIKGSISSFFWLQGPPDVLYLTEYYKIIINIMINVFRNGIYDNRKGFWISNVTRYVKFKAPYLPSFDFKFLQMSCI